MTGTPHPIAKERTAERHAVELLVRYAWKGLRATVMLRDLTRFGARIEGMEALRKGDGLTLFLPGLPPCDATVAWAMGRAAGLSFDTPLALAGLETLVRDYAPASVQPFTPASLPRPAARPASVPLPPIMRVA